MEIVLMGETLLITGASGFVGRHLCQYLLAEGVRLRGTILPERSTAKLPLGMEIAVVEPLGPETVWDHALVGVETIVHLAARVHVMDDRTADPLVEYRLVNTEGTVRLAREAVRYGVRRFVYISSIKVNGEESPAAYTERSATAATDPYGISKLEAERALREIEAETGLQVVILRPTLVYGPEVKANFLNMLKAIDRGLPLPLALINNQRSLIYSGNFIDAIKCCSLHPLAAGQTFLVSDGEDVSTPELIQRIAAAMGKRTFLFPLPLSMLRGILRTIGKGAVLERLTGSLMVDSSKIRERLGWKPPFTLDQGLAKTSKWFMNRNGV